MAVLKSKISLHSSKAMQSSEIKNAHTATIMIMKYIHIIHAADNLVVHGTEAIVVTSAAQALSPLSLG